MRSLRTTLSAPEPPMISPSLRPSVRPSVLALDAVERSLMTRGRAEKPDKQRRNTCVSLAAVVRAPVQCGTVVVREAVVLSPLARSPPLNGTVQLCALQWEGTVEARKAAAPPPQRREGSCYMRPKSQSRVPILLQLAPPAHQTGGRRSEC